MSLLLTANTVQSCGAFMVDQTIAYTLLPGCATVGAVTVYVV